MNRNGWGRCPGIDDFKNDLGVLGNVFGTGSSAAVLDQNFAVQAVSKIDISGDLDWNNAVDDVRLWTSPDGDVVISFVQYDVDDISNFLIAKLHLSASAPNTFKAWINRHETRQPASCHSPQRPMKNLGILQSGHSTYILEMIYPTSMFPIDLAWLNASEEAALDGHQHNVTFTYRNGTNKSFHNTSFAVLCAEPQLKSLPKAASPWHGVTGQWRHFFIHNGPSPVWIDELQVFLGIGHLARGQRRTSWDYYYMPDHYTHQFFTLGADAGNTEEHAEGQALGLLAVSPEFCFSSAQSPQDPWQITVYHNISKTLSHQYVNLYHVISKKFKEPT